MTKYLEVEEGQKILEVGSGSGWQAAILAELVGPNGAVFTVERVPELIEMVTLTLSTFKYKNITLSPGDGTLGREDKAPFDRIMVTAAAPYVPKPLVDQLGEGGRMIIPVGPMFGQMLTLVTRNKEVEYEDLMPPVMFVPLIGKYGYKEGQV
jgi:protein-L-isoaspartate(D-aspartate) O-methyltransferase